MFKKSIGKIVSVKWRDSTMYITQVPDDEPFDITIITSIGKLVQCDAVKVVLAGDILGDDYRRVITIPVENIIELSTGKFASK